MKKGDAVKESNDKANRASGGVQPAAASSAAEKKEALSWGVIGGFIFSGIGALLAGAFGALVGGGYFLAAACLTALTDKYDETPRDDPRHIPMPKIMLSAVAATTFTVAGIACAYNHVSIKWDRAVSANVPCQAEKIVALRGSAGERRNGP